MMYWVKFYEEGVFVTVVGQPHDSINDAQMKLVVMADKMHSAGFNVNFPDNKSFTYDRYGTLCTVKIEEAE